MTWIQLLGTLLAALVSALTVGGIMRKVVERYAMKVFDEDVMKSLQRQKPQYREFHADVFQTELERGRRTADIALGLQHDITGHIEEFRRFRSEYSGHQELLITIPQTVVHLDQTMKRLDSTLQRFGESMQEVREDVAYLKAKTGGNLQ